MNRRDGINHMWSLMDSFVNEFCVSKAESDYEEQMLIEAFQAIGITEAEARDTP